jgi:hypothetical protein
MWTKEDLQNKYVKLSSQQDYETVTKVLHEFEFRMYDGIFNDGYYESYPFLNFYSDNTYYTSIDLSKVNTEIPIQQFYDYLKPKTLKVEDLVEGEVYRSDYGYDWLFKYNENNDETVYYLTPTIFSKSSWGFYKNKTITPCSSEDKLWLEACIKADKFIPKEEALKSTETKYEYEVVHCTTQEEWDFVLNKLQHLNNCNQQSSNWRDYNSKSCLNIKTLSKSDKDWYLRNNGLVYSFQEWCDKFGYKPDFKPKFEVGKWYKFIWKWDNNSWYYGKFKEFSNSSFVWSIWFRTDGSNLQNNPGFDESELGEYHLLTDLSEIQQYLPDGHVDKIKVMKEESLVGRYLKYVGESTHLPAYGDYFQIQKEESGCNLLRLSDNANNCSWNYENVRDGTCNSFELMPKGFTPDNIIPVSTDTNWIPEVGEYAVMVNAGGWSYSPDNNSCVAKITEVNAKQFYNGVKTYTIAGKLINPRTSDYNSFNSIPLINSDKKLICRKAEPHEIPNTIQEVKEMSKEELLKEAKKRYPIGCHIISTLDTRTKINNHDFRLGKKVENNIYYDDGKINIYNYSENKWAEIVSLPESSIVNVGKNEYPVTSNEVFQQEGLIDTNVNKIQSVSVELYQPEELQLF